MADLKNTSDGTDVTTYQLNPFFKNRVKYHSASRLASQTGEGLAQAMNVDGHIVTTAKVWAAPATAFPNNADKDNVDAIDATNDLVTVFKTAVKLADGAMSEVSSVDFWSTDKADVKSGKVWTNTAYPAVKLYENVPMTAVKGSDGGGKFQSFEILAGADGYSEGTLRVSDWVTPTSVADLTTGKVVAGFSGIPMYSGAALTKDTSRWSPDKGTWEFVYIAGMLTFEPGYTPQDKASTAVDANTYKSVVSLTAFKYCGEYLDKNITSIETDITDIKADIANLEIVASGKEIATADIVLTSTDGKVSVEVAGEVLVVKEGTEEIQPDMTFDGTKTVLSADYGKAESVPAKWTVTYRVIA